MNHKLLGVVLPTNSPDVMKKYLLPSLKNAVDAAPYMTFLINFQSPWTQSEMDEVCAEIKSYGFDVLSTYNQYEIKGKGLVPVNQIREDTARICPDCRFYMIFDDDMSFMGPSATMPRNAGEQILESLAYLLVHSTCGILVFGGTLIKKIKKDTIAPIDYCREYVTGKGIIFRNCGSVEEGLFVPIEAYHLLGSDEEKVAAAYRISKGLYTAEMPFVRINHYENQRSSRNKNGKIPGKEKYEWNTDEIKDNNNFGFIREHYCSEYSSGNGYVVSREKYAEAGGEFVWKDPVEEFCTMDFSNMTTQDLIDCVEVRALVY